jgi:two-component system, NtrC family, sensor histidine kinase KinB
VTLRGKLVAAQAPLAAALIIISVVANLTNASLGRSSSSILKDNYRSMLAGQRMKEAIERMDSAAVLLLLDKRELGIAQATRSQRRFEDEIRAQEANITEAGEAALTAVLRASWTRYQALFARGVAERDPAALRASYFGALEPAFLAVKNGADAILAINEDAMVHKSDRAQRAARLFDTIIMLVAASAFVTGILASTTLTTRIMRPLSVLTQAARRLGEGDMQARARVDGRDELAGLALEFNTMADRLTRYRHSSLGDLLQAQQQAQAAIDSLSDPILVFETDGTLLSINRAAETTLRIDLASEHPLSAADPVVRDTVERLRVGVMAGKKVRVSSGLDEAIRVVTSEGEASFLPQAAPMKTEEGGIVGCTIVLQDVTRLLRFDELKNNLVATVAHEFRTPLTSLRMAVHLCAEEKVGPINERQADLLFAARQDTQRLQQIVDDLLNLSRIQSGRIELHARTLSVDAVVAEAVQAFRDAAAQKAIKLQTEVLPGQGDILADPERIGLVFSNLIGNALKYTPEGGAVTVRARRTETTVRFEVEDTGPGVPIEHRQSIFERFFRVPGSPAGGAGLGLFIASEVVRVHGGSIGVGVTEGSTGGARFWFEIPAAGSLA